MATRSEGKLRELRPMLEQAGYAPIDLTEAGIVATADEDGIEAYDTFEANALAKARHFHRLSRLPTIADDSGLVVDALAGAPGVHSKRWSGRVELSGQALDDANNAMLLTALKNSAVRTARYVCVAAFVREGRELTARGETEGEVTQLPRGVEGFGYDPYFWSQDLMATFGESSIDAKAGVSHRGRAVRALLGEIAGGR
ncbi:MAG: non-canonical purine NTP pyrophosphatase [Gemmatimonadaceae bacterium]